MKYGRGDKSNRMLHFANLPLPAYSHPAAIFFLWTPNPSCSFNEPRCSASQGALVVLARTRDRRSNP
jgi:hypothetical protein